MGNHWDKNFDQSNLSEERRYGLLTHRYGYKELQLMRMNKFWMIFKITLYCCSISYLISYTCKLEFDIFLLHRDMINQNFCPNGYPCKFYASPPTTVFFDVITDKANWHARWLESSFFRPFV